MIASMSGGVIAGIVVVVVVVVLIVVVVLKSALKVVQQGSVGVVKRLGEFKSVRQPGIAVMTPLVDRMEKVDIREFPHTGDRQAVITADNVSLQVSATIFAQVLDVKAALYEIEDYQLAIDQFPARLCGPCSVS